MTIRNLHFYNRNALRPYPVDDTATLQDDSGLQLLPHGVIVDMNFKFPDTVIKYAFISSLTVTGTLVSVTIQGATALDASAEFLPLAVATITAPFTQGVQVNFDSQYPGAGGWLVFGSGVNCPFQGRFSTAAQTLLARRAAKPYRKFPIEDIAKVANSISLTGIVTLLGQSPVEVVAETRDILGEERDVIVVRLVQPADITENVFELFSGPCSGRPESETCQEPASVEFINNVPPDCDGNICIEFQGCAEISQMLTNCGVVLDCDLGLGDACQDNRLPDEDGRLPNEYDDLCFFSESLSSLSESFVSEDPEVIDPPFSPDADPCSYPHTEEFDDLVADDFEVVSGGWGFCTESSISVSSPVTTGVFYCTEEAISASVRNISLWNCDGDTVDKIVTVVGKVTEGPAGSARNIGVILNYRAHDTIPGRVEYFLMDYDFDAATFRLLKYNGTTFQNLVSAVVPGVGVDELIELEAIIESGPLLGQVSITISLTGIENVAAATLGPVVTSTYLPSDGRFGLHSNRAYTRFDSFTVDEYP